MRGDRHRTLDARLRARGLEVVKVEGGGPEGAADALRAALSGESPDTARVVVAGGDGTINAVLPALCGTEFPLAILPVGSVNVLARELGIPASIDAAMEAAASGRPRRIDLGVANGRPFALMAGIGFDAAVVHSVAADMKGLIGSFAYVARGLQVLTSYPTSHFHIEADGEKVDAAGWLAVVANASRYTYHWRLAPDAQIDDGWLDVCFFSSESALETLGQVAAALGGRHSSHPGIQHLRGKRFRFCCSPEVAVQLDGDPAGSTPVKVEIAPGALTVMVPQEGAASAPDGVGDSGSAAGNQMR
jgi:YegS/Rv2252/BmrU family lipid kinase